MHELYDEAQELWTVFVRAYTEYLGREWDPLADTNGFSYLELRWIFLQGITNVYSNSTHNYESQMQKQRDMIRNVFNRPELLDTKTIV